MKELIKKNGIKYFIYTTLALLYLAAICFAHPQELASGLRSIILSRDALITDYFELVGYGPAFLNAALVMTISLVMIEYAELPFTGLTNFCTVAAVHTTGLEDQIFTVHFRKR